MLKVFVFPGQGTQKPGMIRLLGKELDEVRDVFEMASDISHRDVADLCTSQPQSVLEQTENTQICVTAMNLCFLKLLTNRGVEPDLVLGQSLGQFSAIAASRAMSYEDTFRLVAKRAAMMAALEEKGFLYISLGLPLDKVQEVVSQVPGVEIALINSETQIVLGGSEENLDTAAKLLMKKGAFKAEKAEVDHAFHTSFMKPMEKEYFDFLDTIKLQDPRHRIILNCSARVSDSAEEILSDVKRQCCHTVLWYDSLKCLFAQGEMRIAEVGAGKKMAGIIRNSGYKEKVYLMSDKKDFTLYCQK